MSNYWSLRLCDAYCAMDATLVASLAVCHCCFIVPMPPAQHQGL